MERVFFVHLDHPGAFRRRISVAKKIWMMLYNPKAILRSLLVVHVGQSTVNVLPFLQGSAYRHID